MLGQKIIYFLYTELLPKIKNDIRFTFLFTLYISDFLTRQDALVNHISLIMWCILALTH